LNAFAERVLPEHERQQVLAHIADCSRCRQVIYLAQEAASETRQAVPALVAAPPPTVHRQAWLTNRGMGWVALASAAVFALAIFVHYRQTTSNGQRDMLNPADKPQLSQPASSPPPTSSASPNPNPKALNSVSALPEGKSGSEALAMPSASLAITSPARENVTPDNKIRIANGADYESLPSLKSGKAANSASVPAAYQAPSPSAVQLPTQQAAASAFPNPANEYPQAVTPDQYKNAEFKNAEPVGGTAIATASQAEMRSREANTSVKSSAAPVPAPARAGTASMSHFSLAKSAGALYASPPDQAAVRRVLYSSLPNGLTAVSATAAQHHLLAVDSAGALFLSQDYGKTWQAITQQWAGHALEVRVQSQSQPVSPAVSSAAAVSNEVRGGEITPVLTGPVFELVTDTASVWTSTDGKLWKAKQ
jgi:hypothetical protein